MKNGKSLILKQLNVLLIMVFGVLLILVTPFFISTTHASSPLYDSSTITNLVVLINFAGETNDATTSNSTNLSGLNLKTVLENTYNTAPNSVQNYFKVLTNEKVTLNTQIHNCSGTYFLTLSKSREYYVAKSGTTANYTEFHDDILNGLSSTYLSDPSSYDTDNNGAIDSLSILMLTEDDEFTSSNFNSVLWPHKYAFSSCKTQSSAVKLSSGEFASVIVNGSEVPLVYDTYTLSHIKYSDVSTQNGYVVFNNQTIAHELSHVFGYKDLYVNGSPDYSSTYDDTTCEYFPVNHFDLMGYNHDTLNNSPQMMLSYNRKVTGWLNESNFEEIESNGTYTLQPVTYEYDTGGIFSTSQDRIVSYYLKSASHPYQTFYIEYRNLNSVFDQMPCSWKDFGNYEQDASGLIVYRVTTSGFANNTESGTPTTNQIDIFVFRNNVSSIINDNSIFRNSQFGSLLNSNNKYLGTNFSATNSTISNITYASTSLVDGAFNYTEDTGISIEFLNINKTTGELSFSVNWTEFVEISDTNLLTALQNVPSSPITISTLRTTLFTSNAISKINLSNKNLTTISGLEKFDLSNVKVIDLSQNSLTNNAVTIIANYIKSTSIYYNLNCNNLILGSITGVDDFKIIYGFQNIPKTSQINVDPSQSSYLIDSTYDTFVNYSLSLNGANVTLTKNQIKKLSNYGNYSLTISISGSPFSTKNTSLTFDYIQIVCNNSSIVFEREYSNTSYNLDVTYYQLADLSCIGLNLSNITLESNTPPKSYLNTVTTADTTRSSYIQISITGIEGLIQIPVTYKVYDSYAPTIAFNYTDSRFDYEICYFGQRLKLPILSVLDSGNNISYTKTYIDPNGKVINSIDTTQIGNYKVKISCTDGQNIKTATINYHVQYSLYESVEVNVDSDEKIIPEGESVTFVALAKSDYSAGDYTKLIFYWYINDILQSTTTADANSTSTFTTTLNKIGSNSVKVILNTQGAGVETSYSNSTSVTIRTRELLENQTLMTIVIIGISFAFITLCVIVIRIIRAKKYHKELNVRRTIGSLNTNKNDNNKKY